MVFLAAVDQALSLLAAATAELRRKPVRSVLHVSLLPSFAANWLVGRLDRFRMECRNIELALDPTLDVVDPRRGDADVAIRFGDYGASRQAGVHLADEELSPLLSPLLYGDGSRLRVPRDVLHLPLLQSKRGDEWRLWSEAANVSIAAARHLNLTDYNIVLQAAPEGQGVAVGRKLLVEDHVRSGRLVRPFPIRVKSEEAAYFAVFHPQSKKLDAIAAFLRWLKTELGT